MDPYSIVWKLRKKVGLSNGAIALIVCCDPATISRIYCGKETGRNLAPFLRNLMVAVEACEKGYTVERGEPVKWR